MTISCVTNHRRSVNNLGPDRTSTLSAFRPFRLCEYDLGLVRPDFAATLLDPQHGGTFVDVGSHITLSEQLIHAPAAERTAAVATVMTRLRDSGVVTGWRDELYPVLSTFGGDPALLVERAVAAPLGIRAFGVHVNGFVRHPKEGIHMWVARRSATKPTWPGMLYHVVAGGQPHGISPSENVIKECGEEAGIPHELAKKAKPAGVVSYETLGDRGVGRDVLFVYDLELPVDFVPVPSDGEVDEFTLMPMAEVARIVRDTHDYKPNCNLVVIDFMIRHGFITPEQPRYADLVHRLRVL